MLEFPIHNFILIHSKKNVNFVDFKIYCISQNKISTEKMKKYFTLIIFISLFSLGKSQIWCPPGATWFYGFQGSLCDGYLKFEYVNDTVVNAVNCKVI